MIRRAIALSLTAITALGASAALASSASAAKFTIEKGNYAATVKAVQINENVISNGVRSVSCAEGTLTGTLAAESESIEFAPVYGNCKGNGGTLATVTVNGCKYKVAITAFTKPVAQESIALVCAGAIKQIEINVYESKKEGEKVVEGAKLCTLAIPSVNGLGEAVNQAITGTESSNELEGGATARLEFDILSSNILIKRTFGTAAVCGAAETKVGSYSGKLEATATESAGNAAGFMVG